MVARRSISLLLVLTLLVGSVQSSYAQVAAGAVTGRGVFTLSSSGAAQVAAAQLTVANAIRLLGALGRIAGTVGLAFVVYDITSNTWDWWQQNYESGAVGVQTIAAGSWGLTAVDNPLVYTQAGYAYVLCDVASPWPGVKQWVWGYAPSFAQVMVVGAVTSYQGSYDCYNTTLQLMAVPVVPSVGQPLSGLTGRDVVLGKIDTLLGEIDSGTQVVASTQEIKDNLQAARNIIASGVALTTGATTSIDPAASVGAMPGAVPVPGEPPVSATPATDFGVAAAAAAISAAIAASQAAVVSAIGAVSSAIAASQAAVVSAVQAVAAPIVAEIAATKAAVVAAVQGIPVGGAAGAKEAIDEAAAAAAARDQAATAKAAAVPSPVFVCPECVRVTSWAALFTSLQGAAAAAPIFALISRLAWPGGGTVQRTWNVGSWQGRTFSVDLDAAGIGTAITVVRFVVVGGAVIVAYMIIFG